MSEFIKKIIFYGILILGMIILANLGCGMVLKILKKKDLLVKQAYFAALPNFKDNPEDFKKIYDDYYKSVAEYVPFVEWHRKQIQTPTLNVDSLGYRIHAFDPKKINANSLKVYFFGGSTMWGTGVDDNHTIPALFNQLNPTFEVHNAGETGFNSRQSLEALINILTEGKKVDIAVFYEGFNDINKNYFRKNPYHAHAQDMLFLDRTSNRIRLIERLFYGNIKALFEFLNEDNLIESYNIYDKDCGNHQTQELAQESIKIWELAKNMVEKQGGKFILIVQPTAVTGNPNISHLKDIIKKSDYEGGIGKGYRCIFPIFQDFCTKQENRNWAFDFTHIFDGKTYYFYDVVHVSANGNQKVAVAIDSLLKTK